MRNGPELDRLWATCRLAYVESMKRTGGEDGGEACFFCTLPRERDGAENLILLRRPQAFVMLNRFPYNSGHLMIAPLRHVDVPSKLGAEEAADIMALLALTECLLQRAFTPDGFNVGMNLGRVAGAGVPGHLHLHVVPRWSGDTNFMPLLANTKVMVEGVEDTYRRLARVLAELGADASKA